MCTIPGDPGNYTVQAGQAISVWATLINIRTILISALRAYNHNPQKKNFFKL